MTFVFFPHRNKLSYFPCHSHWLKLCVNNMFNCVEKIIVCLLKLRDQDIHWRSISNYVSLEQHGLKRISGGWECQNTIPLTLLDTGQNAMLTPPLPTYLFYNNGCLLSATPESVVYRGKSSMCTEKESLLEHVGLLQLDSIVINKMRLYT